MIPDAIKRALNVRQSYKRALTSVDGERVLDDLIRKYVLSDPCRENADVTLVNIGKQRVAIEILQKVYGSEVALRKALERSIEETNNQSEI